MGTRHLTTKRHYRSDNRRFNDFLAALEACRMSITCHHILSSPVNVLPMTTSTQDKLPRDVAEEIEVNLDNDLRKDEVAEIFYEADRPYLEANHVEERIEGNFTRETVLSRLKELVDAGILRQDTTGSANQYWIAKDKSYWMVPDDVVVYSDDDPEAISLDDILSDEATRNVIWGFLVSALSGISLTGLALIVSLLNASGVLYTLFSALVTIAFMGVIAGIILIILPIVQAKITDKDTILNNILPI